MRWTLNILIVIAWKLNTFTIALFGHVMPHHVFLILIQL